MHLPGVLRLPAHVRALAHARRLTSATLEEREINPGLRSTLWLSLSKWMSRIICSRKAQNHEAGDPSRLYPGIQSISSVGNPWTPSPALLYWGSCRWRQSCWCEAHLAPTSSQEIPGKCHALPGHAKTNKQFRFIRLINASLRKFGIMLKYPSKSNGNT